MAQRGTQQLKAEQEPMESSAETWREEVQQLREALAEKEEQLSKAVKRRQMRTVAHVETLTLLNSTQAALKESKLKCASLEETLHSQQQEKEERRRRELMEQEEGLNHKLLVIEEELERQLEEEKQRNNEEKEAMRQQLFRQEEKFKKLLDEERHKYDEKIVENEESLKQQLMAQEENFNKMLADVCQRWESTAQKWAQKNEELEHRFQESLSLRQHEEEENKEELQRLSEAILQLELQVLKKQEKKSFWRWKFWKKRKQTTIPELPKPSSSSPS
ncbi:trichohyalin-like [Takifugu flavidus]|uniref:Uncharacterized protein n=1 Tax=Takifugu flavidus TaxID=433684 RepID=A0A5C6N928_9TELE|nr:trichohyalin-like [Takifugu flavidus]TWW63992.1 hypothetical protein D4764_03G0010000 [Takifugu flavidus]